MKNKTAVITFLGNAFHDSRVVNLIESLNNINYSVRTISFDWKTPNFKTLFGQTTVYKLDKSKSSIIYYLKFIFLLLKNLRKTKADIYFAEDIYTLPFTYYFAKKNKAKIFYNSREIYAHLAGLRNKSFVSKIISKIESKYISKVDVVLVTGQMDADYLSKTYNINNFCVIRNLPKLSEISNKINLRQLLSIPNDSKIILYQGVILEGRGIEKTIYAIENLQNVHFVIIGEGEFKEKFENETKNLEWHDRIHFIGVVDNKELLKFTAAADLGLALIENISISYYYALPNKLFEYIMAGVPVLASNLPQMMKIIDQYKVGAYINLENKSEIIDKLKILLSNNELLKEYKTNCLRAKKDLNWDKEFSNLKQLL